MSQMPIAKLKYLVLLPLLALTQVSYGQSTPDLRAIDSLQLTPEFWVARLERPDVLMSDTAAIDAQNEALFQRDSSMWNLRAIPATLHREQIESWIVALADAPKRPLYDISGAQISQDELDTIVAGRNIGKIPPSQATRFGLVVRRANLRSFPTDLRVFRSIGNTDIDRFQETALFPGTPVVIAHDSSDHEWWFVVSPRYAAWVRKEYIAEGNAETVLNYPDRRPFQIITGATAHTVYTPEEPAVSELQLDMGVRVPVLDDWQSDAPVNGQHRGRAYIIELPVRDGNGALRLQPALLPGTSDSSSSPLPLTRANIIQQGFKFLGERYGWGHSYNGRDCSGFVSEVYRSMGVLLPRNTSAQGVSPALQKRTFDETASRAERMAALESLDVGDLIYIPGHVMMVIGFVDGAPWVIHDTTGISFRASDGKLLRMPLNAVSVTPFLPLHSSDTDTYVDIMTSIVRPAKGNSPDL